MQLLTKTFCAILLFAGTMFPQVTAVLTIENQQAVADTFFFDLYLRTSQSSANLYLGNADFVLTFNAGNFTSPQFTPDGDSPGFCTLEPTNNTSGNNTATQLQYFDGTACDILNGNELVINLDGPGPGTQTTFNNRVARIDATVLKHRLGRFKVSGIINPSGFMNLQWKTSGTGSVTQVFTLGTVFPWTSVIADTLIAIIPTNAPLPVELTSFTSKLLNDKIQLNWVTKTEVNNYGFNVERKINEDEWNSIGFVEGHGNSNSPKEYSYSDKDLFAGGSNFQYRLKQVDTDGQFEYSDVVEVEIVPTQFELSQNYPNPFNPTTTIRFSLPQASQIKINIYNVIGELVATLAEGMYEMGNHKIEFDASSLPSGAYIYRLVSDSYVQTKKMLLLK